MKERKRWTEREMKVKIQRREMKTIDRNERWKQEIENERWRERDGEKAVERKRWGRRRDS